jgi:hypothetical protein
MLRSPLREPPQPIIAADYARHGGSAPKIRNDLPKELLTFSVALWVLPKIFL